MKRSASRARGSAIVLGTITLALALSGCTGGGGAKPRADFGGLTSGWNAISPGGETTCSDGSPFRFFVRPGDPGKLLFYLQGGGACWFRGNCDPALQPSYNINLEAFDPARYRGIFDFERTDNPFARHSIVFVPYCTGDVHLGKATRVYPPRDDAPEPLTIEHQGFANVGAALAWVEGHIHAPDSVFVTGSSAGAIPSPYYALRLAELFPDANLDQLGDGAGGYRREARTVQPHDMWGTLEVLGKRSEFAGYDRDTFNYETLYIEAARALPDSLFAEYDTAEDAVQKRFLALAGDDEAITLGALIDANQSDIRARVANFRSYVAAGDLHTILGRDEFYTFRVGDQTVRDWVAALAAHRDPGDVHCDPCEVPAAAAP
jgi:hypothetical protein